jgi:hypothetical protein
MRLDQLLSQIGLYFDRASGVDIRDLTLDSRQGHRRLIVYRDSGIGDTWHDLCRSSDCQWCCCYPL